MHARTPMQRLFGVVVAMAGIMLIGWQATQRAAPSPKPGPQPRQEPALSMDPQPSAPQAAAVSKPVVDASQPVLVAAPALVTAVDASPAPATGSGSHRPTTAQPAATRPASARSAADRRRTRASVSPTPAPSSTAPCAQANTPLQGLELAYRPGSATLLSTSGRRLTDVASHLKKCPTALLEVRAYAIEGTDSGENLMLSRQRAQAVVGHLVRSGIAAHRLVATYRGDRAPGGNRSVLTFHTGNNP